MAKLPWMKWYPGDWLKDPAVRGLSTTSKGVWIQILNVMWESPSRGKMVATKDQFCRLLGVTTTEFEGFVSENVTLQVAEIIEDVTEGVTLINRRMFRDDKSREQTRLRVKRHRYKKSGEGGSDDSNACVTAEKSEVRSQKSETDKKQHTPKGGGDMFGKSKDGYSDSFEEFWRAYPPRPSNPKQGAYEKWKRLLSNGVPEVDLIKASTNYARYRKGEGTKWTLQAQTFLGPQKPYEEWIDPKESSFSKATENTKPPSAQGVHLKAKPGKYANVGVKMSDLKKKGAGDGHT